MREGNVKYPNMAIATASTFMVLVMLTLGQLYLIYSGEPFTWWWELRPLLPVYAWVGFFLTAKIYFR